MIPVLYLPNAADFSTFGLGVLTDTISCEVTEERNGVFECLLKYPVSGQRYGLITKECIIKAKPNDTAADQAFRIYRITKPLNGIVTIYGQHISYDLANVPVMPFSTESRSPQLILSQLLAGDTRFTGWTDYSDAKVFSVTQPKSVRACLGGTEGSMLSKWYGEFEWDNFTVKFHSHRGQKTGVVIEYGKNLTDMEQDEDNSGVYTALLPYAVYTPEGSDTEMVITLPEVTLPIVTSEIVRAKTLIMDFSDQFDGVVTEEALRAKANSYIKANPLGATIPTVKVSFEVASLTAKAELWRGSTVDTTKVSYKWAVMDTSVTATSSTGYDADFGIGWRKLSDTADKYTGTATNTLTVYATAVDSYAVFKCCAQDTDSASASYNTKFFDVATFIDNSDPLQIIVTSTGGDVFKNGQGTTVLTAVCYQAGSEVDAAGNGSYTWTKYNKDGVVDTSWGTNGSKTGKTLSVSSTDVDTKATFMVVVAL